MKTVLELIAVLLVAFATIVGAGVVAIASVLGVYADEPDTEIENQGETE